MSAAKTAATLRVIRDAMGRLMHPDASKVWSQSPDGYEACRNIKRIGEEIGLTRDELREYGRNFADRLEVRQGVDGRFRFGLKDGDQRI